MSALSKVCFAVALALCVLMPSGESLWMDEAQTYRLASMPTLAAVFSDLRKIVASESLMPLGIVTAWCSARIVGVSEWELRAVNILWGMLATAAFAVVGRKWRIPWAPLFLTVQPFLWFYMNEARPYALQIACGAWLLAGLVISLEEKRLRQPVFLLLLVASCILVGTTLFGILTVLPVWAAILWRAWREHWPRPAGWPLAISVALVWCAGFGIHYLLTLSRGAGGVRLWDVGLQNIGFAIYEFAGFSGLGPGRNELRELAQLGGHSAVLHGFAHGFIAMAVLAAAYAALLGGVILRGAKMENRPAAMWIAGIFAVNCATLVLLALVAHFPFWGRHLAPAFPFFCALLLLGIRELKFVIRPVPARAVTVVFFSLLTLSSLGLRFQARHAKDDYRAAASIAKQAMSAGQSVWWSADPEAARYYRLGSPARADASDRLIFTRDVSPEILAGTTPPQVIVSSKPDAFDPLGTVVAFIRLHHYRSGQKLSGFQIFLRPQDPEADPENRPK